MVAGGRRLVGRLDLGYRQLGLDPRRSFALHDQRRLDSVLAIYNQHRDTLEVQAELGWREMLR